MPQRNCADLEEHREPDSRGSTARTATASSPANSCGSSKKFTEKVRGHFAHHVTQLSLGDGRLEVIEHVRSRGLHVSVPAFRNEEFGEFANAADVVRDVEQVVVLRLHNRGITITEECSMTINSRYD